MASPRVPLIAALVVFAGVGFGAPFVDLWLSCRKPISEACVWGKAYLPLAIGLWAVAGLIAALAVYALLKSRSRG